MNFAFFLFCSVFFLRREAGSEHVYGAKFHYSILCVRVCRDRDIFLAVVVVVVGVVVIVDASAPVAVRQY